MLELNFNVKPDANGIIDGRELASGLIQMAYALLTPYVDACPACADRLFSVVANMALEDMHQDSLGLPCRIMNVEPDENGALWKKHVFDTGALTELLLGKPTEPHRLH